MGIVESVLERLVGKVHFYVFLGKNVAAEITVREKEILVDVRNPVLAVEAGIEEMLKNKNFGAEKLKEIKELGYKIRIRYKGLGFEL